MMDGGHPVYNPCPRRLESVTSVIIKAALSVFLFSFFKTVSFGPDGVNLTYDSPMFNQLSHQCVVIRKALGHASGIDHGNTKASIRDRSVKPLDIHLL